jgi:inosose dehydratase
MALNRRRFLSIAAGAAVGGAVAESALAAHKKASFKIGITTLTRGGWEKDFVLACRECSEVGYKNIETFVQYVQPYWEDPGKLRALLDGMGLKLETVSNGGRMLMSFEDAAERARIIEEHMALVRFIKSFGCDHLKINTGRRRPEGTTPEDLKAMSATFNELGKRLSDEGLKFGVHAHLWTQFQNRNEIDAVMELTDPRYVYFVLDTGHITMAGMDPVELARVYVSRIVEFHMKDTRPEKRGGLKGPLPTREQYMKEPIFFELGKGGVDFPAILGILKKAAWQGWLTVELDESRRGPKESARISKDYIEKVLKLQV